MKLSKEISNKTKLYFLIMHIEDMKLMIGFRILNLREHLGSVRLSSGIGRHSSSQPLDSDEEDTSDAKLLNFKGESTIFLESYEPIFEEG